jgi:hypothetical protein
MLRNDLCQIVFASISNGGIDFFDQGFQALPADTAASGSVPD